MKRFLCKICNNQCKISNGDFLFNYNINCCNNHIFENIDYDFLVRAQINPDIFKCKNHKRKNLMHCFDCDEDICFHCLKLHSNHKIEYLNKIDNENKEKLYNILKREKIIFDNFLSEIRDFKNKMNIYIDKLIFGMQKLQKLRYKLIDNKYEKEFTFIDIENAKMIFNNDVQQIKDLAEDFSFNNIFIKKYESFKNILEFLLKKGKFIEGLNIKNIYDKRNRIIPINKNYILKLKRNGVNKTDLSIKKVNKNMKLKTINFDSIYNMTLYIDVDDLLLKDNNNIEKELSFYILNYYKINNNLDGTELTEITIKDILSEKRVKNIKNIINLESKIKLLVFNNNENIVFSNNIILYDNSFNKRKIIDNYIYDAEDIIKINKNIFAFTNHNKLYIYNLDEDLIDKTIINNCGNELITYSENKKILFSQNNVYLYLINFNSIVPECIQKIKINFEKSINHYNFKNINLFLRLLSSFNDDNIFIETFKEIYNTYFYYRIHYIVHYEIIGNELKEISNIEIERKKLIKTTKD